MIIDIDFLTLLRCFFVFKLGALSFSVLQRPFVLESDKPKMKVLTLWKKSMYKHLLRNVPGKVSPIVLRFYLLADELNPKRGFVLVSGW